MARFDVKSSDSDFSISFSRGRWKEVWDEADRNVGAANLTSLYAVEGAEASFSFTPDDDTAATPVASG